MSISETHRYFQLPSLNLCDFVRRFPTLPRQLKVTLHKRGRLWHGPDVATYTLECSSDCDAKGKHTCFYLREYVGRSLIALNREVFELSPTNGNRAPRITMRLVVTISGNLPITSRNAQIGSSRAPAHELPGPTTLPAHEEQNVGAKAEADAKNASASLIAVNPKLAPRLDRLSSAQVPGATDAASGLASVLSNLEGFVKIADLLADVRNQSFHAEFDFLIDLRTGRIASSSGQRGVEPCQCRLPSRSGARRS